jgi:hypothetical protein
LTPDRHDALEEQRSNPRHVHLEVNGRVLTHLTPPVPPLEPEGAWTVGDPIRFTLLAAEEYGMALIDHYGVEVVIKEVG